MERELKEKRKKFIKGRKIFFLLLVICLGVGFALLSTNLTITGNTNVSGNKWKVYFDNVEVSEGSVEATVAPTTSGTSTTTIDYTVSLDEPGNFYEFTVDAVNAGTIDAMIQSINMTSLDTDVAKYLSYTATYLDGTELAQNDVLASDDSTTYKVRVEFKRNISPEDLSEERTDVTLTFGVNYVQSTIKPMKFIELVRDTALNDSSINFRTISSDSNGKGLYVRNSTIEDTYPIYYYRGAVTNNNAKFAGFCWKIVRTTETGGTKLLYNGIPDGNGNCTNTIGDQTRLSDRSKYTEEYNSPAYVGYMYGTVYKTEWNSYGSYLYGNSFTYNNGNYTLVGTRTGKDSTHHYTCFNTTGQCSTVSYVYNSDLNIKLKNGESIEDAFENMQQNTTNSVVKTVVDNWFSNTFINFFTNQDKDFNNYLEDTIWCNDRRFNNLGTDDTKINNGWIANGGNLSNQLYYMAYGRKQEGTPVLTCHSKNDSFTVTESTTGNGALTYPVGLLTADEIMLAGGSGYQNSSFYLNTTQSWWAMSPGFFSSLSSGVFSVNDGGYLHYYDVNNNLGVRPSISLKGAIKVAVGGDGTAEAPYGFIVE